jgi:hypothetical protein
MPSVYVLTIGGVTKYLLRDSLRINESANRPGTCSFDILSDDDSGVPSLDDETILTENGTRIFGGLIDAAPYKTLGSHGDIVTRCSAVDFNTLIDRRVLNITAPPGSLESVLLLLEPYTANFGVTLDGAQVTGPTLLEQHFYFTTLRRAYQLLSDQTDYVVEIDYNKSLRMKLPSATACPFNVTTANVIGEPTVTPTREDYANRIIILGGSGQKPVTESFTADGSTDSIDLNYTLAVAGGVVLYEGVYETLGTGATWEHSTTGGVTTITRTAGNPTGAVSLDYVAHFPKLTYADSDPIWDADELVERILTYPDVFDVEVLQELADKWVARTSLERKRVVYATLEQGAHPGQTQTITLPTLGLSGTFTITDVSITILGGNQLMRTVTALEGDTYLANSWQDDVATWGKSRSAASASGGVTTMTAGTVSAPAAAAPPLKAVQFNRSGAFGGKASFIFHEDENSVVIGDGSTITAAGFDSCFIAGQNCHITDP